MPTYPVINLKTKEKQELSMTMKEYDQWRKDNPDWDKDWQAGVAAAGEVGEWRDKMASTHPGWADIMKNKVVPKAKHVNNKTITDKYRY
tara:strand:- start:280 stop:546 length:267 start_codon:yes stop_codon:yes gene_type:complete